MNGSHTVRYQYDPDSLVDVVDQATGPDLALVRNAGADFGAGLLTGTTQGSVATTETPSAFGELASLVATESSNPLYSLDVSARDLLGRIETKTETIGTGPTTASAYTYDAAGRLDTVTVNGTLTADYAYDANGNRTHEREDLLGPPIAVYDDQDRLLSYAGTSYTYSAAGDLETSTDASGTTTYGYDALGNLRSVELPDGEQIEYGIDGQNRRVGKKVCPAPCTPPATPQPVQGFLYGDQLRIVAELDESNDVVSRFVYATRPNVPDFMVKGGTTYRILSDQVGSVRLMVDATTGAVVQRIDYDAFGSPTYVTGSPDFQPFGFAGGLTDLDTGLVRFGVRDYDPRVGRWTSKDLIRFVGDDANLYGYVLGDPVSLVDPTGLYSTLQFTLDAGNFLTGVADAASLGLGPLAREYLERQYGAGGSVNPCSSAYAVGTYGSLVLGTGRLAYAGAAKAIAATAGSGATASAGRQVLKRIFRGGLSRNPRGPGRAYDTDAELRTAAGRTNPGYNALGANGAIGGALGASNLCGCP